MNFVDKHNSATAHTSSLFGSRHDFLDLFDSGQNRAEWHECGLRHARDYPRERCFADAGGPPENHRGNLVPLDRGAQRFAWIEEMALAEHLVEILRPHAIRQRAFGRWAGRFFFFKKVS